MGEAIGLIIAAVIAAVVAFLSLVISKEQSVSEFRQQWIDALRKDIAIIIGRVIAIQGESLDKNKDDWTGFHRAIVRIRLRLNPKENSAGEKHETEAVLKALEELESMFPIVHASAKPQHHELNDLVKKLVDNSQKILKANWDRVREGEEGYRKAKSWAVNTFWVSILIGIVVGIGYVFYKLNMICH
jgi:ElaB/YqjD/DUF883 family membrane-anchored ribosome-binding protein